MDPLDQLLVEEAIEMIELGVKRIGTSAAKAIAIIPIKRTKTVRTEAPRIRFLLRCTRFFIIDFLKIFLYL